MRRVLLLSAIAGALWASSCRSGASADASHGRSQTLSADARAESPEPRHCGQREAFEVADDGGDRAFMRVQRGDKSLGLPLESTSFDSFVVGTVAETRVVQRYHNPFDETIEALYVFPLPRKGAVYGYAIHVADRTIRGIMKRRAEAEALYQKARAAGHTAGLLEQERPNVFTQRVANLPPGERVTVELHVVQPLDQEAGRYSLVLPTVVGPRYVPGLPTGSRGRGFSPDTDRVPDGSRITPRPRQPGAEPCTRVEIEVRIEAGMAVRDVRSKHHDIDVVTDAAAARVSLTRGGSALDRDFDLSFRLAGDAPRAALMVQPDGDGGYFTLTVQPPERSAPAQALPRELVFVVDNSGSMHGEPIAAAKTAMRSVLRRMGSDDVFSILKFSQTASSLASDFLPNRPDAVRRGIAFVDAMTGSGGTNMLEGIRGALRMPGEAGRVRMVLFLTDGYIGNEAEIFAAVERDLGDARIFGLGVGSSVNRHLLDGLSRLGRGAVTYLSPGEDPKRAVERFYTRIDRPLLSDLELDFGDLQVTDVVPARLPDLFHGQPVVVYGRYRAGASGVVELRARARRVDTVEPVRLAVPLHMARPDQSSAALSAMWARARIAELEDEIATRRVERESLQARVIELALAHRVMTRYTAFVAVDERRVVEGGRARTVEVPIAMPAGVSYEGVFGARAKPHQSGGVGRLGLGQGFGTIGGVGYGRGAAGRGRVASVPRVRSGKVDVRGVLAKQVIERIVRRHRNEVRWCYEQALQRDATLAGRVTLRFVIEADGQVSTAAIAASTLGDARAEQCFADAVRRWTFPSVPEGGTVVVTYPYMLEPAR